jgi:glycosyltransferase involved in cell wall biosynthesis
MPALSSATIVITTKDRRDDLREALSGCLAQTADVDVLVIDDGSSDGTAQMVAREFPTVRLHRSDVSRGLIVQRTTAATLTSASVIVSIDDDARLVSPNTIEQTLEDFDDPRIGAVAIPYVDVRRSDAARQRAPDRARTWVTDTYIGTAHALRRDVFLSLGGYRASFLHMVEEPEFCTRMLAAGFVVRLGTADELHHLETSQERVFAKNVRLGVRNQLLDAWYNTPTTYLPGRLARVLARSALDSLRWRHPGAAAAGTWQALRQAVAERDERSPVTADVWRLLVDLRRRGPLPIEAVEQRLPPVRRGDAGYADRPDEPLRT